MNENQKSFWQSVADLENQKQNFAIITIIDFKGSIPQELGAKMAVTEKGLIDGTIGGGKLEKFGIDFSIELLKSNQSDEKIITKKINLQKDIGMSCGGEATLLIELFRFKSWKIVIFGAGHVSQALIPILKTLKCELYCIDQRNEWLDKLPNEINKIHVSHFSDAVAKFNEQCFFLTITMGHAYDVPILYEIFKQFPKAKFVGGIGSH